MKLTERTLLPNASDNDDLIHLVDVSDTSGGADGTSYKAKRKQVMPQTFTNDAARTAAVPGFIGQLGTQLDTKTTYISTGLSAGNWQLPANTQIQSDTYGVASGTNTYVVTLSPGLLMYGLGNGFHIKFTNANTAASTLNVNGLGAKNIFCKGIALSSGLILANTVYIVTYDGTQFHLIGAGITGTGTNGSLVKWTGTNTIGNSTVTESQIATLIADDLWEIGAGASSLKTKGNGALAAGANAFAAGVNAIASVIDSIAIGHGANGGSNNGVAIGKNATTNTGSSSNAIGDGAHAGASYCTQLNGALITKKDDGQTNYLLDFSSAVVTIMTPEIDLKTVADYTIAIGVGVKFFPDSVELIITSASGVTGQPTIRAGITGTLAKLLAAVATTGLTVAHKRQRFQTLLSSDGEGTLTAGVTVAATGTGLLGRFVFKGVFKENE